MRRCCAAALLLAWVGWTHMVFQSADVDEWTPTGATESLEECKQATLTAAENTVRKFQSKRDTTVTKRGAVIDVTFASGERASISNVCLPDTIDPRGPKGK